MDEIQAWIKLGSVTLMIGGLLSWLTGDDGTDNDFCEAHDLVLDALSDADQARTIEAITDRDIRSQLSVEQALELHRERELRRMRDRN